jgi:aspartate carbamoyltransferase regulatory subunit
MTIEFIQSYLNKKIVNNNHKDNNVIKVSITDPRATVKIIKGNPILNH